LRTPEADLLDGSDDRIEKMGRRGLRVLPLAGALGSRHGLVGRLERAVGIACRLPQLRQRSQAGG
jgi:hypothetical protein